MRINLIILLPVFPLAVKTIKPLKKRGLIVMFGGERGIRTLDRDKPIHTFQACAFNRSASSP